MSEVVEFQVMPPLSMEEYNSLHESIEQSGVQVPIVVDETGTVIDGHHRKKIAAELGVECPRSTKAGLDATAKRTLALSLNLDRRHLNREQRRELIAASVKADPQLSDNTHAKRTGASDKTVTTVRRELEESSEIPNFERRQDPRTGNLSQPIAKVTDTTKTETYFDAETGEVATGDIESPREPAKPRRRPITDQAHDAGWDMRKIAERLARISQDDRFNSNKEQVATHVRGHLQYAVEVCQDLLDQIN